MSEFKVTGTIAKIKDVQTGTSKAGKEWKKQEFVVKTDAEYNNLYCFTVFGDEKVENLTKYNKEGDKVAVSFNINTKEWQDKHFTDLGAWRIEKVEGGTVPEPTTQADPISSDLPF